MTAAAIDSRERPSAARFAGLDGYRGLAATAIVVYHVYQHVERNVAGSLGAPGSVSYAVLHNLDGLVSLFFVLSAFLLAIPYVRAVLDQGALPSARAFLTRRAARIVPLYVVAILVVWASRNINLPGAWQDLLLHLTFTQVYSNTYIFYTIGPAWSLAVEIQFYLILALAGAGGVTLAARMSRRAAIATMTGCAALLFAGSLGFKIVAWSVLDVAGDDWKVWFGLPAKLDEFALGIGLAIAHVVLSRRMSQRAAWWVRIAGLAVVVIAFATRPVGPAEHVVFHTITAVGFALLLAAGILGPSERKESFLSRQPLALLGLVSYSLYMWHEPIMIALGNLRVLSLAGGIAGFLVTLAAVLPVSVAAAWVSYQLVERPGNSMKGLVSRDGSRRDYYDGT